MKEKGELSSLLFGVIAIAVIATVLIGGPALMDRETTGFFPLSFEEEAPPQEPPPIEAPPEVAPEPPPAEPPPIEAPPEPIHEPKAELSPKEIYEELPEEAQVYVTVGDIEAMDAMGVDPAGMETEIAEMILEEMVGEETGPPAAEEMPPEGDYGSPEGDYDLPEGGIEGPPCSSEEECNAYCSEHPEECMGGGMPSGDIVGDYGPPGDQGPPEGMGGPGGCQSEEECTAYCMEHPEECGGPEGMGPPSGYGPPQQMEEPKAGPGGCKTMRECMEYCKKEENHAECGRTGAPEDQRRGPPPGAGPPEEIPEMILERGMEKDFIEIMCLEMHLHMAIPIQHSIKTTKEVFADAKQRFDLQSLNTSKLEAVNVLIERRIDALCNSNKDNFGENMNALMKMVMPGGAMETAMRGIGDQIDKAFLLKIEPGEQNAIKRKEAEMEKERLEIELQYAQEEDKRAYLQNRINELNAIINDTSGGMTMEELEAFSSGMGDFMDSVQERMHTDFEESPEYKELAQKVYEKEYEFFLKMMELGLKEMEQGILEMEAQGLDASALKEMKAFMEGMKEKGKEMLKDEYKKQEFFEELESRMPEFEKKINDSMRKQTKELFLPKAENNLIRLKNAVELAKEKGINVNELETLVEEIELLIEELKVRIELADSKEDFMEIGKLGESLRKRMDRAEFLYEQLRGGVQ